MHLSAPFVYSRSGASVDFLLRYRRGLPLAVVREGRKGGASGLLDAAQRVGAAYAYAAGRQRVREWELASGRETTRAAVPGPETLWRRYRTRTGRGPVARRLLEPSEADLRRSACTPEGVAVQRALEAVARGRRRIALTLPEQVTRAAVAARVVQRLTEARWSLHDGDRPPRVLYLALDATSLDDARQRALDGLAPDLVLGTPWDVDLRVRPAIARLERGAFDLVVVEGALDERGAAFERLEALLERTASAVQLALYPGWAAGAAPRTAARFGAPIAHTSEQELAEGASAARLRAALGSPARLFADWPSLRTRGRLLGDLAQADVDLGLLASAAARPDADALDLLAHVGFGRPLRSRRERAVRLERRAPRVWRSASDAQRERLAGALEQYVVYGLAEPLLPAALGRRALRALGGARSLVDVFGGERRLRKALRRLTRALYDDEEAA